MKVVYIDPQIRTYPAPITLTGKVISGGRMAIYFGEKEVSVRVRRGQTGKEVAGMIRRKAVRTHVLSQWMAEEAIR